MLKSRKTSNQDASLIKAWIAADPNHQGLTETSFFLPPEKPSEAKVFFYAIEDEQGPIFFVRGENCLRLHIQFAPNQKRRMVRAISEFASTMAKGAKKLGYSELIFESVFHPLIRFLRKRGFKSSQNEQILNLR
jgi:hypothetical protein